MYSKWCWDCQEQPLLLSELSYSRYLVMVGESLEKESFFVNIRMRCIVHHFCYTKVTPKKNPTTRVGRHRKNVGGRWIGPRKVLVMTIDTELKNKHTHFRIIKIAIYIKWHTFIHLAYLPSSHYCNNGSVRLWQEREAYPIKEGKVYVPLSLLSTVVCVHCRLYTAGGKEKGGGVGV